MRDFNGKREAAKKTFEAFIIERLPSDAITKDEFGNYKALSIHQHYLVWDHQQRKIEELQQQNAELMASCESFRDSVLHQRWNLEDNGMTSDQINDVLNLFDTLVGDEIAKAGGQHG